MSLIAGVVGDGQLWDEEPECVGYAHQSEPLEQLVARWGESHTGRVPFRQRLVDRNTSLRLVRLAGMISNGDYPSFKGTPELECASPSELVDKVNNMDLPNENRRILAILPATEAVAIYSVGNDLVCERPLSVWALFTQADGSYGIEGMDGEHFLCDEWANFLSYDSEPPKANEFHWGNSKQFKNRQGSVSQ
jgi:hypothetical protein